MTGNTVSIREMSQSLGAAPHNAVAVRQLLGRAQGTVTLQAKPFSVSLLLYNLGLLVFPAPYKGSDRSGALAELIARIKAEPPDVVCLCEVFSDGERSDIRSKLSGIYSYYREGPDENDIESDGGLLLLSKTPFMAAHNSIFRQCAGGDCFANKGVIFVRSQPAGCSLPLDIFLSHTQNIEESGGTSALYSQLDHMANMVSAYANPATASLIAGDLNIPGEVKQHYDQLIKRLEHPVDLWRVRYPTGSGTTFDTNNNFYENGEDAPSADSRLDYCFLHAGSQSIPVVKNIQILKWSHNGRQISDHYGLLVKFEQCMNADMSINLPITGIEAIITGFRCIETTSGPGSDEVSFSITLKNQHGKSVSQHTPVIHGVDTGEVHHVSSMPGANLAGDPGSYIDVTVAGEEHDTFSNQSMGIKSIQFDRNELMLSKGQGIARSLPYLTSAGGEYCVDIHLWIR